MAEVFGGSENSQGCYNKSYLGSFSGLSIADIDQEADAKLDSPKLKSCKSIAYKRVKSAKRGFAEAF